LLCISYHRPDDVPDDKSAQVLNVGHAKLAGKVKVEGMTALGALILNDNEINQISGTPYCSFVSIAATIPPSYWPTSGIFSLK
jgi:hypothetical protein